MFSNLKKMWRVMLTANKQPVNRLWAKIKGSTVHFHGSFYYLLFIIIYLLFIYFFYLTPIEQCHNAFRHENICPRQTINDMGPHTKLQS